MPENTRLKLVATPGARERVRILREAGRQQPIVRVGEITAGGNQVVTTAAMRRRDPNRPRDSGTPEMIGGMAPTGELETPVRNAIADTVSKLFNGALKVRIGRERRAVSKHQDNLAVAARNVETGQAPTPQRAAMAAQENGVRRPKSGTGPVKMRGTLDVFGVHFTDTEREIFRRFVSDAENATKVNIISKMYDNMPRGGGGQGSDMSEAQRFAYQRFYFVWRALEPQFQTICQTAVLEVRSETLGRALSMEELGQQVTNYTDKALCRAAALGMTKATLWRLAGLYLEWNKTDEDARKVLEEAQAEMEANRQRSASERIGRARPVEQVKRVAEAS